MGSNRKKKEKAKDFKKTKLKVGKTAAKPNNFTDTSFVAKTISLPNQSIGTRISTEEDLIKRLLLTKHHSNQTRKETLIYIQQHLPDSPSSYKQILNSIIPLILDQSLSVRTALQELLVVIATKQPNFMELHARSIVLYIHSAMTHITPAIRNDSVKFLNILIKYGQDSLVRAAWIKTLKSYFTVLNWTLNDTRESVSFAITTSNINSGSSKAKAGTVESLVKFLRAGAFVNVQDSEGHEVHYSNPLTSRYLFPVAPQPFAHLKLFDRELKGKTTESSANNRVIDLNVSCEDWETRRKVLKEFFVPQIEKNLESMIKEGGELGNAAKSLQNLIGELKTDEE